MNLFQKNPLFIIFHAALLISANLSISPTHAGVCNPNVPVKTRIVISWCGDCTEPQFLKSVSSTRENLSRDSDLLIEAITQFTTLPPLAKSRAKNTISVSANKDGLDEISSIIKKKFAEFKKANPKADPQSFEVNFISTNHGTLFVGKNKEKEGFGLTIAPNLDGQVTTATLSDFGASLPKGIRLKTVFGQCFGADTAKAIRDGFAKTESANCSCDSTLSEPGMPSFGNKLDPTSFEKSVADYSGQKNASLAQAHWAAFKSTALGFSKNRSTLAANGANLSSEQIALEFFKVTPPDHADFNKGRLRDYKASPTVTIPDLKPSDMEIWEKSKLERRKAMAHILEVSPESRELEGTILKIKKSKIQVAEAPGSAEPPGAVRLDKQAKQTQAKIDALQKEMAEMNKKKEQYYIFDPRWIYWDQKYIQKVEELTPLYDEYRKIQDKKSAKIRMEIKNFDPFERESPHAKKTRVASLLAREEMEAQFLKTAPADLKQKFLAARACELEKFGPGPVQYQDETSSGAHAEK